MKSREGQSFHIVAVKMANSVAQAQKSPGIYNPRGNRILRKAVMGPSIRKQEQN